jgi:hypothetical protein
VDLTEQGKTLFGKDKLVGRPFNHEVEHIAILTITAHSTNASRYRIRLPTGRRSAWVFPPLRYTGDV